MSPDAAPAPLPEGTVIGGRYRVLRRLGGGGMGVVYEAEHTSLGRRVALKMLREEATQDPHVLARFFQEARSAASIGHKGIVDVFDLSQAGEPAFLVMELLEGEELADRIHRREPLTPEDVLRIGAELAEAVAAAHEHGIVHRDLKPQNVFLSTRGGEESVKVLDFGIAKLATTDQHNVPITKTGEIYGTPAYMAPEQMRDSRNIDGRVDVWAIGAILYEALAGTAPFDADTMPELIVKIVHERHQPITVLRPDVRGSLAAVIERCLEKDRDKRTQSAADLARQLRTLERGESLAAAGPLGGLAVDQTLRDDMAALPADLLAHAAEGASPPREEPAEKPSWLGRLLTVGVLALVCLAGGAFGYWFAFDGIEEGREEPAEPGASDGSEEPGRPDEAQVRAYRDEQLAPLVTILGERLSSVPEEAPSDTENDRLVRDLELYLALTAPRADDEPAPHDGALGHALLARIRRETETGGESTSPDPAVAEPDIVEALMSRIAEDPDAWAFERDATLVDRVRSALSRATPAALVLSHAQSQCAPHALSLADIVPDQSSPLEADDAVPGAYTARCFRETSGALLASSVHVERVHRALGIGLSDPARALRVTRNHYLRDYAQAWLTFLRSVRVRSETELPEIATLFGELGPEERPPLELLFRAVEENTSLDPESLDREARNAWREAEPSADVHLGRLTDEEDLDELELSRGDLRATFAELTALLFARDGSPSVLARYHGHLRALHPILLRRVENPRAIERDDAATIESARAEVTAIVEGQPESWRPRVHALLWPPILRAAEALTPPPQQAWYR